MRKPVLENANVGLLRPVEVKVGINVNLNVGAALLKRLIESEMY